MHGQLNDARVMDRKETIAVVGLGAMGLVTVKNLREEGFQVTGFEKNGYIGGLWHFTADEDTLSVLETTQINISVDKACYTDFPFPNGTPQHCSAKQVEQYMERYADHFNLGPHCKLNTAVERVSREDDGRWRLDFKDEPPLWFDKVVMATGPHVRAVMPTFQGAHLFTGRILHVKAFKRAGGFAGQRVIVVGLGNSSGDVCHELIGHASSILLSHNRGAVVMPREVNGVPLSHRFSYRFFKRQWFLDTWAPRLSEWLFNRVARGAMDRYLGPVDPSWGLHDAHSIRATSPVISDNIISNLRSGTVESVAGVRRITGPRQVQLTDGRHVGVDAIICCTGYENKFSVLAPEHDPTAHMPRAWIEAPGSKGRALPRLYQNVFSMEAPDSLAFVGCVWFVAGAFCLADLASMCIAQVWAGKSQLPGQRDMMRWADEQERRICALAHRGTVIPSAVAQRPWLIWADGVAGMGMEEHLGWGWKGWSFWWREHRLWNMLMDGVLVAAVWRLFDGKRRAWEGARGQIERVNGLLEGGKGKME